MIEYSELSRVFKKLMLQYEDDEIKKIIEEMDYYGNGMINYTEFLAAVLSVEQVLNDE